MALADYSTTIEKIAALMSAKMDPALINIEDGDFTTDGIIYLAGGGSVYIDGSNVMYGGGDSMLAGRIENNAVLTPFGYGKTIFYVKDSDIVYNNPIEIYQRRLAYILESDVNRIDATTFTAGTYGSIITSPSSELRYGSNDINRQLHIPCNSVLAVASGHTIYAGYGLQYFDVQSDW